MRLSTRLLGNATSTYLRLGTTFFLGLFTTWYLLGAVGVLGFGLIALAVSSTGLSHALERSLRFGLVRELAAAGASGDPQRVSRSVNSAFRLCLQILVPVLGLVAVLALAAGGGLFNTPESRPDLRAALVVLILGEGVHAAGRLLGAPYLQLLFASQRIAIDNVLMVIARASYALSAVVVFGWFFPGSDLLVQLTAFAVSRATLQLFDVALGIYLAKRQYPGLRLNRSDFDEDEYRSVRDTVWNSAQVSLLLNINPQFLAVLINLYFGLAYNTVWQIVVQFSGYAWMVAEGLLRGIDPLITHLQQAGRSGAVKELMARSVRYQFAIALPAAIFLGVWVEPLLDLWVGARWALDTQVTVGGLSVAEALTLASRMAIVLLTVQALRAGFFAVERGLYGLGKVRSYSWFSKWATLITVGGAAISMAVTGDPMAAPLAMLVGYALYSPGVVVAAARREIGLAPVATLRRALPRPIVVALLFLGGQLVVRARVESLDLAALAALLAGSAAVYFFLVLALVPEADERTRIAQLRKQAWTWLRRRAGTAEASGR